MRGSEREQPVNSHSKSLDIVRRPKNLKKSPAFLKLLSTYR